MDMFIDSMQHLPGIFAIRIGPGYTYRLYTNKIHDNINIICPVENHRLQRKYYYPVIRNNNQINLRKWYDIDITECMWTFIGIEFLVLNENVGELFKVPLIFFITEIPSLLPVGSDILECIETQTYNISHASEYMAAITYTHDPFNHQPSSVVPLARSSQIKFPAHVKHLIIEDAIRKKDSCVISRDEITQENASVTSCGHVFTTESIKRWLDQRSSNGCCPLCKQVCELI